MKKSIYTLMLLTAGLLLLVGNTFAQRKLSLTTDQAIETGLQNSKTLHSSLMKVKSAKAKHSESVSAILPSLTLTGAYRRLSAVDPFSINLFGTNYTISPSILDAYSAQLSLFQPVF